MHYVEGTFSEMTMASIKMHKLLEGISEETHRSTVVNVLAFDNRRTDSDLFGWQLSSHSEMILFFCLSFFLTRFVLFSRCRRFHSFVIHFFAIRDDSNVSLLCVILHVTLMAYPVLATHDTGNVELDVFNVIHRLANCLQSQAFRTRGKIRRKTTKTKTNKNFFLKFK